MSIARSLAYRPDGKQLASSNGDSAVYLWNPDTGEQYGQLEEKGILSIVYRPDGKQLACNTGNMVQLWNMETLQIQRELKSHTEEVVLSIAFSPDGKQLASGSDGTVCLWNPDTGEQQHKLDCNPFIRSFFFSLFRNYDLCLMSELPKDQPITYGRVVLRKTGRE